MLFARRPEQDARVPAHAAATATRLQREPDHPALLLPTAGRARSVLARLDVHSPSSWTSQSAPADACVAVGVGAGLIPSTLARSDQPLLVKSDPRVPFRIAIVCAEQGTWR